jgi:hypothetical protein
MRRPAETDVAQNSAAAAAPTPAQRLADAVARLEETVDALSRTCERLEAVLGPASPTNAALQRQTRRRQLRIVRGVHNDD